MEEIRKLEERELLLKEGSDKAKIEEFIKDGEYVYELYSIMIHTGGAFGGHYFAYIKSFEDGKWYNFIDASVNEIKNEDEIFKTFGGQGQSNTAYMLMYRKITGKETPYKFSDEVVPAYLKEEIEKETQKLIAEQKINEEKMLQLKLKVYQNGNSKDVQVKKTQSLRELI